MESFSTILKNEGNNSILMDIDDESYKSIFRNGTSSNLYEKYIKPRLNKGFVSNLITFLLTVIGFTLDKLFPSVVFSFIFAFGLFGFSGGITNWLAIKMLFDPIPGLYGSGIIPKRFKEIRETVKNVIMRTFFDEEYLQTYLNQKAGQLAGSINLEEKLTEFLKSPEVDSLIEKKLGELAKRPEGAMFAFMGINPVQLKPIVMPFVLGLGSEVTPMLTKNFDIAKFVKIETIRSEVDQLMSTKLLELTPDRVKQLMEDVIREHLGWLIVWGCIFGSNVTQWKRLTISRRSHWSHLSICATRNIKSIITIRSH